MVYNGRKCAGRGSAVLVARNIGNIALCCLKEGDEMKKKKCPYNPECQTAGGYEGDFCIASVGGGACSTKVPINFRNSCKYQLDMKLLLKAAHFLAIVTSATPPDDPHANAMAIHEDPWHQ